MCRSITLQRKGNALQEHFHELAITSAPQKPAGHRWSSPYEPESCWQGHEPGLASSAPPGGLPCPKMMVAVWPGMGATGRSCVRASGRRPRWGSPPHSGAHLSWRHSGFTSTCATSQLCPCLAMHPATHPLDFPLRLGPASPPRALPAIQTPGQGWLPSLALPSDCSHSWNSLMRDRCPPAHTGPAGQQQAVSALQQPLQPYGQPCAGTGGFTVEGAFCFSQGEVGTFQLSLEESEGPIINIQGRTWTEVSGERSSSEEVWRHRFSPTQ